MEGVVPRHDSAHHAQRVVLHARRLVEHLRAGTGAWGAERTLVQSTMAHSVSSGWYAMRAGSTKICAQSSDFEQGNAQSFSRAQERLPLPKQAMHREYSLGLRACAVGPAVRRLGRRTRSPSRASQARLRAFQPRDRASSRPALPSCPSWPSINASPPQTPTIRFRVEAGLSAHP